MKVKVTIIQKDHPHYGELAELPINKDGTISIWKIFGKTMTKVKLLKCLHGVNECFVNVDGFKINDN